MNENIIYDEYLKLLDNISKVDNINKFKKLDAELFCNKLLPELFECFWNNNLYILKKKNIIYYTSLDDLEILKELKYLKLDIITEKDFDNF